LLKIKAKNTEEYSKVAQEKILKLGGLEKLESFVVYHTAKEEFVVEPKE
jgi:DNA-binding Lrp family transcriptional regulator